VCELACGRELDPAELLVVNLTADDASINA